MKNYTWPDGFTIKDGMTDEIKKFFRETPEKLTPIIKKRAFKIQADTAGSVLMPVKSGTLKGSIAAREIDKFTWVVEDGVEYGVMQELGTKPGVPARHFLSNATERNADGFFNDIKEAVKA